jgi:hypothetical protein
MSRILQSGLSSGFYQYLELFSFYLISCIHVLGVYIYLKWKQEMLGEVTHDSDLMIH